MPEFPKKTSATKVFAHLTADERIDQACEILALGVLRLARKRGFLGTKNNGETNGIKNSHNVALYQDDNLISEDDEKKVAA
jgi:hypothetical protein